MLTVVTKQGKRITVRRYSVRTKDATLALAYLAHAPFWPSTRGV